MFLDHKGTIEWTTDLNRVSSSYDEKILVLGEYDISIPNKTNDIMTASILLPPYECTALQLDGNLSEFESLYIQYLNSPDVRRYFSILFTGLLSGFKFLMYIGYDEMQLPFFNILLNYFNSYYGIIISHITSMGEFIPFQHNFNNPHVIEVLYEFDQVTPNFLMTFYPVGIPIPIPVAYKMAIEFGFAQPNVDPNYYSAMFTDIRNKHSYGDYVSDFTPIKIVGEGKI